jgi:hypothetical protein
VRRMSVTATALAAAMGCVFAGCGSGDPVADPTTVSPSATPSSATTSATPSRVSTPPVTSTPRKPSPPATSKTPDRPKMGDGQSISEVTGGALGHMTLRRQRWRTTEFGPLYVVDVVVDATKEIELAPVLTVYDRAGNTVKQHRYPIGYGRDPRCLNCKRRTVPAGKKVTGTFQLQVTKRVRHGRVSVLPGATSYYPLFWEF